mmetsp:Transcript_41176/g.60432  ORF Transcript_41176/g.60432 Transcript_41176/m.60432 type:complete len:286 (-) Transcript_41176:36-893(-)|eukprot:CAMPEP_0195518748 /NCGR_PEP_ID=MMETSP0794_2-20130614/13591_1 /TAXON_ID=515487 /ORGANISM="Stephanopyxis turris, Strain CCMP 815" /LENGTH=285 /DNA_ID=CAMNT_0040647769 /DNA_START=164 /DNA_END=1021 /DNA_ORIENTATION=+
MPVARVNDNQHGLDDLGGPEAWFKGLPIITRCWFAAAFGLTCFGNFGFISVHKLVFMWEPLKDNFELWRILTPFCYAGPFKMETLFALYMLVTFSERYEAASPYNTGGGGGTADYAFCVLFGMASILLTYPLIMGMVMPIFCRTMTFYVLYIWSKQNPNAQSNIWGVPIKALHLPFAYLGLSVLMGNPYLDLMHGMVIGHVYYFLVDVVPVLYGKDLLHTPQFLIDYFGVGVYVPPAAVPGRVAQGQGGNTWSPPGRVNAPNDPGAAAPRRGYDWGSGGQTLGSQ